MKSGDIQKLELYLMGIKAKIEKNLEYFLELEFNFKSGHKNFQALYKDNKLTFNGVTKELSHADVCVFFKEEAQKYNESQLILRERGASYKIDCNERGITYKQFEEEIISKESSNPLLKEREYFVNIDKARELLKAIGILTKEYKLKNDNIRKYNQIDRFVELVAPMYKDETGEIIILDLACGKSYLSFVMNYYLRDVLKKKCKIIGVDYSAQVIKESNRIKDELGYKNMEFIQADLREYIPPKNVTGVISLHACDIATDLALATAIKSRAKYINCVPCCHKELLGKYDLPEYKSLFSQGILKARLNDIFTDGLRSLILESEGYDVSLVEYISPLDTPKNILLRAVKTKENNDDKELEVLNLISKLGIYPELYNLTKNNLK